MKLLVGLLLANFVLGSVHYHYHFAAPQHLATCKLCKDESKQCNDANTQANRACKQNVEANKEQCDITSEATGINCAEKKFRDLDACLLNFRQGQIQCSNNGKLCIQNKCPA